MYEVGDAKRYVVCERSTSLLYLCRLSVVSSFAKSASGRYPSLLVIAGEKIDFHIQYWHKIMRLSDIKNCHDHQKILFASVLFVIDGDDCTCSRYVHDWWRNQPNRDIQHTCYPYVRVPNCNGVGRRRSGLPAKTASIRDCHVNVSSRVNY